MDSLNIYYDENNMLNPKNMKNLYNDNKEWLEKYKKK